MPTSRLRIYAATRSRRFVRLRGGCSRCISDTARSAWVAGVCSRYRRHSDSRRARWRKVILTRAPIPWPEEGPMIRYQDSTRLSLLYHLNSEPWQNAEAYQGGAYEVE